MNRKIIFRHGSRCDEPLQDIGKLIQEIRFSQQKLRSFPIESLVSFFDQLALVWANDRILAQQAGGSLKHLGYFMKRENIVPMLQFAFRGNYKALDSFQDFGNGKYQYKCQPRGLAVHWLAGNVGVLGIYSVVLALLTKNVSILKASSHSYQELILLLESFFAVQTQDIKGSDLLDALCVVLVDASDIEAHTALSASADIRIAWGGEEAVSAIMGLKKNIFAEDIIFGPKYSYALVDRESAKDCAHICRRLAFDVSTFDQYACSSPHTVFVESGGGVDPLAFAEDLARALEMVDKKFLPKQTTSLEKKMEILTLRAKYAMTGKVLGDQQGNWTVIYTDEPGFAPPCFSRVVFVKPISSIKTLGGQNTRKIQTIGIAMEKEERFDVLDEITQSGGDRCVQLGDMTLYESPWDGFFPTEKMVRWVSAFKK
ncbi:MAG: hypothetical protein HYV77_04120 [Candidatus Wildermuthbacteria bacterium]|nr:hypothetical protein [Candidatus Wildermuthbacteria bacterium]